MAENVLVTRALTKRYGGTLAVDHADITLAKGEIYGLVGRNGAGKTTIIRMAAADINLYSRTAQGVRVMRVDRDTKVIALARVPKENEEEDAAEEANQAGKEP